MAVLATGCFFLPACENTDADLNNLGTKKLGVEEAKNIKINFTTAGKAKAVLTSPLMLRVQDTVPYTEFPKTLFVNFYSDKEIVESTLKANYAKYRENQNIIFLKDSVRVINIAKGDTLYCQELYWDRKRTGSEFYTDKPVKIRTRTQILDGIGMEASQDFKEFYIIHPIGTITVPRSRFPQ